MICPKKISAAQCIRDLQTEQLICLLLFSTPPLAEKIIEGEEEES
jgi:hypothetical protein